MSVESITIVLAIIIAGTYGESVELTASSEGEKTAEVISIETKRETKDKAPKAKAETKKTEAKKSDKEEVKQVLISNLTKEDIKKMGVKFVQYSDKCVSLTGETRPIKDDIKKIAGGHWNSSRKCWFIKNDNGHQLAKLMGCKVYKKAE